MSQHAFIDETPQPLSRGVRWQPMRDTILVCDDEELVRWSLAEHLRRQGYRVIEAATGAEFLAAAERERPSAALLDLMLPDTDGLTALRTLRERGDTLPVVMLTAVGSVDRVVEATRLGASTYLTKPFELTEVADSVAEALRAHRAATHVAAADTVPAYANMVGDAPAMRRIFSTLQRLETVDTPSVLITGESGTGKDLVAQAIHSQGPRASEPFVEVDCASIPEALMESTLFGHERGAFTDAKAQKRGLFEEAGRGVVFLDELGELPLAMQAKLLRALENRTFKRVGGNRNIRLEAAVIAATNRDLQRRVDEGAFRKDLYYRIAVVELELPSLAQRREDIAHLVQRFVESHNQRSGTRIEGFTEEAIAQMQEYAWPGNVRELRNVVERALLFADEACVGIDRLPANIRFAASALDPSCPFELPEEGVSLDDVERGLVMQALRRTGGNQTQAAKLLGLSRYALRTRMRRYDLNQ